MSDKTLKQISEFTIVLCRKMFEATEVKTPTCFVILPDKIDPPVKSGEKKKIVGASEHVEKVDEYMTNCFDLVKNFQNPYEFAKKYFESKMMTTMFLYLVDEYNGKPVYDPTGVYPIEIGRKKKENEKIIPIFMLGIQTMAIANKAAGLISMFCPGVPSKIISKGLLKKANAFAEDSSLPVIIEAWNQEGKEIAKRGGPLREFECFLELNDRAKTYSSLKRVCNKDGNAIWITEESHNNIEKERIDEKNNFKAEIDQLKTDKKEFQTEKKELQKELQIEKDKLQKNHHNIEKERNDEKNNFKAEIDKLKTEKKEFQTENDNLQKEFKTEITDLEIQIDTLKKKRCSCTIS